MAFNPLEWLRVARTVDRLLGLEAKHTALIEAQSEEIQELKDQHVAELARHVGAVEERTRRLDRRTPPEPGGESA